MEAMNAEPPSAGNSRGFLCGGGGAPEADINGSGHDRRLGTFRDESITMSEADAGAVAEQARSLGEVGGVCEDYLARLRRGVSLWNETYVPTIAPDKKRSLIPKWARSGGGEEVREVDRCFFAIPASFPRARASISILSFTLLMYLGVSLCLRFLTCSRQICSRSD